MAFWIPAVAQDLPVSAGDPGSGAGSCSPDSGHCCPGPPRLPAAWGVHPQASLGGTRSHRKPLLILTYQGDRCGEGQVCAAADACAHPSLSREVMSGSGTLQPSITPRFAFLLSSPTGSFSPCLPAKALCPCCLECLPCLRPLGRVSSSEK